MVTVKLWADEPVLVTLTPAMKPEPQELIEQLTVRSRGTGDGEVLDGWADGEAELFDGFADGEAELFEGLAEADGDGEADDDTEGDGDVGAAEESAGSGTVVDSTACKSAEGCTITGVSSADAAPPARIAMNTTRPTRMAAARPNTPRAMKNWRSLCLDNGRSPR
ncbi:hypothetical protein Aiant_52590 [Actinoplanes ianthinogenes]|uniref:Uncharacterized protein n=1 Tax=Actinoplanes ianthinogenes TaxID=122358 RepID=A0ABN6CGE0_9ACTN|nr:hypothetical protein Aiant_52590 [Actinoplanes ianthinogenes]